MPKVIKIDARHIAYKCTCGADISFEVAPGETPRHLVKCFDCIKREGLTHEQALKFMEARNEEKSSDNNNLESDAGERAAGQDNNRKKCDEPRLF